MRFRFEGTEYGEIDKFLFSEVRFCERQFETDIQFWTSTERMLASYFLSVRRDDPQKLSWERMLTELGPDAFEILKPPAGDLAPAEQELPPEEEWPVDPTDAGPRTDPSSESGQSYPPPAEPVSPYFGTDTSSHSPYVSGSVLPYSMP